MDIMKHDFEITEKLPPEFKKKWVEALRSGKYKQGSGQLYSDDYKKYCCLGVAGSICGISKKELDKSGLFDEFNFCDGVDVPNPIKGDDGENVPGFLANANDSGATFEEIANWIEEYL